ncbi:hypothetical protein HYDPIDRAFT_170237 [Hydnomerulius pinastri MD-312]|uniref:NAD(P)-binding protein n=1 Tax=Hydnomerulius pinastri MD-312 TaxID=994086 RepID=A0A0C9WAG1_9AGAM|nr:hypothetical protein HYDPIDRAFT_170237 [Hydnomerulius pinastri MD-312]
MGLTYSLLREVYPPTPSFTEASVPDLSGKVVIVTGANAGIGKETARVLLAKNAKVYIACRDASKGEAALKGLKDRTGRDAYLLQLNLSNLKAVKAAAEEFTSKEKQLHILFNNAYNFILWDVTLGALTQLYAGTSPEAATLGGQYLVPWARLGTPRADTGDEQLGKELWTWLEEQVERV